MALHTEWGIIDSFLLALLGSVSTASSRGLQPKQTTGGAMKTMPSLSAGPELLQLFLISRLKATSLSTECV